MKSMDKRVLRLLDANMNRAKEGLRVCEDICRFIYDKRALTKSLKEVRHQLTTIVVNSQWKAVLLNRSVETDVGRQSTSKEMKRGDVADVLFANIQRVKESLRVLEEFAKLFDKRQAQQLKTLRYTLYALEKKIITSC